MGYLDFYGIATDPTLYYLSVLVLGDKQLVLNERARAVPSFAWHYSLHSTSKFVGVPIVRNFL